MARYIDADKLKDRIKASCAFPNIGQDGYFLQDCTIDLIDKQPTADVEKVVRCKDCQYCKESEVTDRLFCDWHREYFETEADNFCSYGERKEK